MIHKYLDGKDGYFYTLKNHTIERIIMTDYYRGE